MGRRLLLLLALVLSATASDAGPVLKIDRRQVNIRADATVQSARVAVLSQDVEVEALGRKDEWFRVRLPDGGEGWIHAGLVQEIVVVTGDVVRLRAEGSTNAPMIATAAQGDELGKVGERGNWYEVALADGERGWIWRELVRPKTFDAVVPPPVAAPVAPTPEVPVEPVATPAAEVRRNAYGEGLKLAAAGEHQASLELFEEVLDQDPDHLNALVHAARAHKQLGTYGPALDRLYHALEIGEGRVDIYLTLAEVYRLSGVPDSTDKYQALFRGEKWVKPVATQPEPVPVEQDEMPAEAWWIYGMGGLGALVLLGGVLAVRRFRGGAVPAKEPAAKSGKGKFAKQMQKSKPAPTAGGGEDAELERQIQQKREDLQQSSAAFLGPNALGGGEDAHMEQVLGQVETLRKALEAQDERARIYADIVRLQNAKIEAMGRELELLRRRGRG